jgi:hypothetical protein
MESAGRPADPRPGRPGAPRTAHSPRSDQVGAARPECAMPFPFLIATDHVALDNMLWSFLETLPQDHRQPSNALLNRAHGIIQSVVGKLVRRDWVATWDRGDGVASAWFGNVGQDEQSKALHSAFTELVRLARSVTPLQKRDYVREEHARRLRKTLERYRDIRGHGATLRPLTPSDRSILAYCRHKARKGASIAIHVGLSQTHTRRLLSRLAKEGRLRKVVGGYRV